MPQSLAQLYMHLIFSTKNREAFIAPEIREDLRAYLGGVLRELDSPSLAIECMADHVHILYLHSKNLSPIKVVEEVKASSSKWAKKQGNPYRKFSLFSVSASKLQAVAQYIKGQERHHRTRTFQEEFREFLHRYGVAYDERYVWD